MSSAIRARVAHVFTYPAEMTMGQLGDAVHYCNCLSVIDGVFNVS